MGPEITNQERVLTLYKSVAAARAAEIARVADLIEQAMYEAQSDETRDALVKLAGRVLK